MMNRSNFNPQVGDLVRIRDWDDMAAEFGVSSNGSINCLLSFIPDMKYLCGTEFVIEDIINARYIGAGESFSISKDMLEPVEDDEDIFSEEIEEFLSGIKIS